MRAAVRLSTVLMLTSGLPVAPGPAGAAFPGANGKIAFRSDRPGNFEIYTMTSNGFSLTNLSNNGGQDSSPSWSWDGTGSRSSQTVTATVKST